jgi:hypothetical protein
MLTMLVGWFMDWIHINMLFYSLTVFAIAMWLLRLYGLHLITVQKQEMAVNDLGMELKAIQEEKQ